MIHHFLSAALIILYFMSAPSASGQEPIGPEAYARVNAALVKNHVLPRYARLASATGALASAAKDFCVDRSQARRARAQARFHDAMDAWMDVQHLYFGPIEISRRAYRFYFWPQAQGKVADAVAKFLSSGNEAASSASRIAQASAALQGFLAVEILLFGDISPGPASARGCGLLKAATENMRNMAAGVLAEWRDGETPFARIVTGANPQNHYFQKPDEATLAFFKSFHDGLQLIAEVKLKNVMGDSVRSARPHFAESRLSSRSLRNVIGNLKALRALYLGGEGPGLGDLAGTVDPKLDRLLRKAFRITIRTARSIRRPLEKAAVEPSLRPRAAKLTLQARALRQIVRDDLAKALGLAVGFNALDGD